MIIYLVSYLVIAITWLHLYRTSWTQFQAIKKIIIYLPVVLICINLSSKNLNLILIKNDDETNSLKTMFEIIVEFNYKILYTHTINNFDKLLHNY